MHHSQVQTQKDYYLRHQSVRIKSQILQNLGNIKFQQKDYKNAIKYFREALIENPKNEDARFNYELTSKFLQKQQQQEQQQNQDENNDDDEKEQNEEQQQEQQEQQQQQQNEEQKEKKEDAEQMLKAVMQKEKEDMKKEKEKLKVDKIKGGKFWQST